MKIQDQKRVRLVLRVKKLRVTKKREKKRKEWLNMMQERERERKKNNMRWDKIRELQSYCVRKKKQNTIALKVRLRTLYISSLCYLYIRSPFYILATLLKLFEQYYFFFVGIRKCTWMMNIKSIAHWEQSLQGW